MANRKINSQKHSSKREVTPVTKKRRPRNRDFEPYKHNQGCPHTNNGTLKQTYTRELSCYGLNPNNELDAQEINRRMKRAGKCAHNRTVRRNTIHGPRNKGHNFVIGFATQLKNQCMRLLFPGKRLQF
jgi:hypothetical protein